MNGKDPQKFIGVLFYLLICIIEYAVPNKIKMNHD